MATSALVLGPGSTFSLHGAEHRQRRKLLVPPFHGKRMNGYEAIVEEEVLRETASWPEGREFATLPSMMRITLNAILRAVFGAEGAEFDELRQLLPSLVALGSRMAVLPLWVRRDFGRLSPVGRFARHRRRYDDVIAQLIASARRDPNFAERSDVLSLLLTARYDDGRPISDSHVADELLTLLAAGHETTATTLAWAVERLRRHPQLLGRLTAEADGEGSQLLQATVWEVQRTHPVIEAMSRVTLARISLGEWVIPERQMIIVSVVLAHSAERNFPNANTFDPGPLRRQSTRHLAVGSFRRGRAQVRGRGVRQHGDAGNAADFVAPIRVRDHQCCGESNHSRGVANAPGRGGRAVVYRRAARAVDATRAPGVPIVRTAPLN